MSECVHDLVAREDAVACDGYCPLCLADELERVKGELSDYFREQARIAALEAALREANADLKAVWIETGKGLEGLKRTEVALGLTAETKDVG